MSIKFKSNLPRDKEEDADKKEGVKNKHCESTRPERGFVCLPPSEAAVSFLTVAIKKRY